MTLPTDRTDINKMLESLIVAATMSEEIVNKSSDSIVILEKVMGHYEYDYDLDNLVETDEEVYINKEELTNLIQALTVGLGKTVIADLTFNQVEIPTSENVDILTASDLLRATITREVMSQEGGLTVEESICDIEYKYNSNDKVMVINQDEIRLLIAGLEALDSGKTEDNKNNNFDNIKIDIKELAADVNKLSGVAASSILRSILAGTLKTETTVPYVGVVPYYQIIGMSDPVSVRVYKSFEVTDVIIYDTLFTEEQVLTIAGKVL